MSQTDQRNTDQNERIPVILCGKTMEVGERVTALLRPKIEVIHFINSLEDAKTNLGDLIAGKGPKSPSLNHIGTRDYSRPPCAVIFGRAFQDAQVKELYQMFHGATNEPVAWIAGDPGIEPPAVPGPDYAKQGAESVSRALAVWRESGSKREEIIYY